MRLSHVVTACAMTAREVVRGRLVLLLLLVIPSLFYAVASLTMTEDPVAFELGAIDPDLLVEVAQRDQVAVFIGLAATGLLTSFVALRLIQRDAEVAQRLVLCGYRASELVVARLLVLLGVIAVVSAYVAAVLPLVFFDVERFGLVVLGFVAIGWVYGCYGLLVGALLRRELEGILFVALLTNLDAGWLQNPVWYAQAQNRGVIRALPAHLPTQTAMAAAFTDHAVWWPAIGSFFYGLAVLLLAAGVYAWRMRRR